MKLKETCLIVIVTAMLCIFAQPALATSAMSVEPAYMGVWQYEEFTVNITVDPAENEVYSASYTLHFDNTILNATLQTQGPFLRQDGQGSAVPWDVIDNLNGTVEYSEYRQGTDVGVSNPGVLAAITFQVIGDEGISELNLSDYNGELLYSTTGSIPTDVNNGRVGVAQAQTPFLVSGYVFNEDGSDYNNPTANITNLNIGKEWTAEKDASSNYYQLTLASCADVIAGEVLQFNAASPDESQSSVTEHTVTQDEVNGGGISNFNITLATSAAPTPTLIEYTISNRTITPPQTTEIDVRFSEEVEWKIAIENGGMVHDWTGTSTNPTKKPWNGTYEGTATIVPDGTYVVNITWTNTTTGLGGQNNTETITVSTSIDSNPPAITDVANTTPTTDSVTITWTTDEASDSLVKYGTTSGTYTDSEPTTTMVTSHSITLTGLSISTTYYFVVNSTDASSNSNESEERSFTTAAESITSPELISCVITPTPPVVQGINISIDCLFSEAVAYEIRIENTTGVLIEEIGSGTAKDPDPKWWNTTTGTPAGTYLVNVTMDNSTSGLSSYNATNTIEVTDTSDTTSPTITDSSPTGTGVLVTTDVTVTFDEAMNRTSAEDAFSILPDASGASSWSGNTMIFTPAAYLADNTTYEVTISTDAKDPAGNPLADPFTWNFTTATVMPTSTTVSIENVTVAPGESVIVPIMVNYVTNLSGCAINMTYNASVVYVTDVTSGDLNLLAYSINNGSGWMYANAINTSGLSGDVVFAYVNLTAVGSKGDTSPLDITVVQLFEPYNPITHTVIDGTFTIEADTEPPLVTDASASRDEILNDNGRARAPGTNVTVLNVTVTDEESDVASVTIDLSSIGGSPVQPMEQIPETNIWTVTTNATDGVNLTHQLTINATDGEGNYNNTVAIELTVLRRGDVCRDNVIDGNDVMYIARYLAGLEPESSSPLTELVGDVVGISGAPEGDGIVDMMDVLYIARCEAGLEDKP